MPVFGWRKQTPVRRTDGCKAILAMKVKHTSLVDGFSVWHHLQYTETWLCGCSPMRVLGKSVINSKEIG